ncbi:Ribonuclease 3 [Trichostrongylus colubriformis]|uniref:Ribonuclease 3 n=1 Tax=Trichostrongylus colubriformis TaxID=6319 RepID=A0AAN8G115_TRICO
MREVLNRKSSRQEFDRNDSDSESDDESVSSVSDLQFSDIDNIVISDDTSELEEGEVLESGEDDRDEEKGGELTLDKETFRRLMDEEYIRIDPASVKIPEYKQHVEPVPCSDYHKSRSKPGEVRSTSDYGLVVDSFRSLLKSVQYMKKERTKLDPVEKILVHSCWKCAQSSESSASESSACSSSDGSDSDSDDHSDTDHEKDLSDISDDSDTGDDDGGDFDDSDMSDLERMNTRQRSSYLLRKEFDRKYRSGAALCEDICFNEPDVRPSTIRIDNIRRPSVEFPFYAIEHKASPPIAYANLKNPELAETQRRLNKLRHAQSTASSGQSQKEHLEEMDTLLKRINELKQQRAVSLNATKIIPCSGFLATGIFADVTAHALLMILAVKHARLHWSLSEFERIIDYKFANRSLIELAFTHPSYKNDFGTNVDHVKTTLTNCLFRRYAPFTENNEKKKGFRNLMHIMSQSGSNTAGLSKVAHNERLEYLGDAVVELIVSSRLFFILPHQEEGGLATYRSALVQNRNLAALGKKLRLGDWMMYAHGIDLCDEEDFRKSLANTFEAVLAAIYLDGGIEECDRIFADAMFGDDATVKDHWLNVPEHPLKVEQPNGDRMIIDDTDELLELTDLEEILGFRFQNIRLLAKALTRRNVPYNTLTCGNNQRLEWLGDAVLQLVISNYLYHHFPNHHEGHLSLLRTCLVCNETQSQICEDLGLHCFIIHPPGGGARLPELSLKDKADLVEALLGAIFVDRGWDYCRAFIYICFLPRLKHFIESKKWNDSKSQLQQCCLALRELDTGDSSAPEMPEYRTIGIEGSTNARHYRVAVYFRNMRLAVGEACTVHLAQMNAAKKALEEYKEMFSSISRSNVKNAANAFIKLTYAFTLNEACGFCNAPFKKFVGGGC